MKIIDDRKDYYDSVAYSMGGEVDDHVMYKRWEEVHPIYHVDKWRKKVKDVREIDFPITSLPRDEVTIDTNHFKSFSIFVVGFAGRTYVGAFLTEQKAFAKILTKYSYNYEEVIDHVKSMEKGTKRWSWGYGQNSIEEVTNIFNKWHDVEHIELFHAVDCPIFRTKRSRTNTFSGDLDLVKNPILKDIEFFKVKDSFSAFQEVEQFIGGVLTNQEVVTPPLSEKQAVVSHGFDPKYGFRKRK